MGVIRRREAPAAAGQAPAAGVQCREGERRRLTRMARERGTQASMTHYEVLGVHPHASVSDILQAFQAKTQQLTTQQERLLTAVTVLSDPLSR